MGLYHFNDNSSRVLALIVCADLRGEKIPTQKEMATKLKISPASVSKIVSDLCEKGKKHSNCPYLRKVGQKIELVHEDELLRESKLAEVLFTIRDIADNQGNFGLPHLKNSLIKNTSKKLDFEYTNDYIDKAIKSLALMTIIFIDENTKGWRFNFPLFEAEKSYLKLVLNGSTPWEIYPKPRRGKNITAI